MRFFDKRIKWISFWIVIIILICELNPVNFNGSVRKVRAESGYYNVASIPATNAAIITTGSSMKVKDLKVTSATKDSYLLSWSTAKDATIYYIYRFNEQKNEYEYLANTHEAQYTISGLSPAQKTYYTICAYNEESLLEGVGCDPVKAYTKPEKVTNLKYVYNKATSMKISWTAVKGATGYLIYRAKSTGSYSLISSTKNSYYIDKGLSTSTVYRYKVCAYAFENSNKGECTALSKMTTLPATPVITVKGGDKCARITWKEITGASGYIVYYYDGEKYQFTTKLIGKSKVTFVDNDLTNGENYKYKVVAYRTFLEKDYYSASSTPKIAKTAKVSATSTTPKLYSTKKKFKKSSAYKNCKTLQKKLNYEKSFPIPGLVRTNVDGFYCNKMCPQGITVAKSYFLLTAYDMKGEENSVIYVLDKKNRKLLTTVILSNKSHVGGIAYDGVNLWVAQSYSVRSIPFQTIEQSIKEKKKYTHVKYNTICNLKHQAATLTYYKEKLWVASYNELVNGYLGAYIIMERNEKPSLKKCATTRVPTKVQGITFDNSGNLILSRSCQTNKWQRGFSHFLSQYKPDISKVNSGTIKLGKCKKTVDMPTMNEEIVYDNGYLYSNFESGAFTTAVNRVDRILAFKNTKLFKK